ncbi:hypothetical protein DPMN_132493 [Dreissena polymorpha]|uniref:Uncharacterized protein n=1 Tax=Dreissena polymorpha TaxID=45954 RepID=A0A9D4FTZ2_DREPO|nr:hypothetical protein DPMN_132493 [Dreissena polymorpha]
MAAARIARNVLSRSNVFSLQNIVNKHARCCSVVAGSTQHALSVKRRIDKAREASLLGGGQKRIEKQHQKVYTLLHIELFVDLFGWYMLFFWGSLVLLL